MIIIYFTGRNINFGVMERKNGWKQMQKENTYTCKNILDSTVFKIFCMCYEYSFAIQKTIILVTKDLEKNSQDQEGCCNIL